MAAEGADLAAHGFPNDDVHNGYFTEIDESLSADDPRRILVRSAQKAVAMDPLPADFPTRRVYEWDGLTRFVAAALEKDVLYRSADSLDGCNLTAYEPGDELGWHFEADVLRKRLDQYHANRDFWTRAIAFTTKDASLNKAHVKYLEGRLLTLAYEAQRAEIDNGNVPQLPRLVESGVVEEMPDGLRFKTDYVFESPSAAAGALLGRAANGRTEWKDDQGRTLKDIQASVAALSTAT